MSISCAIRETGNENILEDVPVFKGNQTDEKIGLNRNDKKMVIV